jgi:hypothetical protein
VQRTGELVTSAQQALDSSPADVAKRALRQLIRVLKGGVAGIQPRVGSRLLDLARAARGHL